MCSLICFLPLRAAAVLLFFPVALCSCDSKESLGKINEIKSKTEELKNESDKLAAETRAVQEEIKAAGNPENTSEKVVATLQAQVDKLKNEGGQLETLAAGLEGAKGQLQKDRAAFNQKYPVR